MENHIDLLSSIGWPLPNKVTFAGGFQKFPSFVILDGANLGKLLFMLFFLRCFVWLVGHETGAKYQGRLFYGAVLYEKQFCKKNEYVFCNEIFGLWLGIEHRTQHTILELVCRAGVRQILLTINYDNTSELKFWFLFACTLQNLSACVPVCLFRFF